MSGNRAFKNLAALRDSFAEPLPEDGLISSPDLTVHSTAAPNLITSDAIVTSSKTVSIVSHTSGKVDGRRERKVLKTPSVSLSVSVRQEIHEDISSMLFAQKSTWIALLDELLQNYVQQAKSTGRFPK